MMQPDFIALQVFLPLIAAPVCVLFSRFGYVAWIVCMVVTWSVAAMCLASFHSVYTSGEALVYHMGGWEPPVGIELRLDMLSSSMLVLVSMIAAVMMPGFFRSANEEITREQQPFFYAAFLLCLSGLLGILSTHDLFNLYVFLELSSLSAYFLIALGRDRRALAAAFQYLVLGTIGATMILIGIGFLYLMTGTLNMSDMAARLQEVEHIQPLLAGFAFLAIGLCMKIALFPLHGWLPNAYAYAPSSISGFLASVATKVAFYAILRIFYTLFGFDFSFSGMHLALIFTALSVPAILIGSVVAIFEPNLKRMLAFSSVAQVGYITMGIGLGTQAGLSASLLHLFSHAVAIGALFLAVSCFAYRVGGVLTVDTIRGMGKRMPFTSLAFALAGVGLIGLPLTGGFIAKWQLMAATLEEGWWLLTGLVALSSMLALVYIWRVVEALYFGEASAKLGEVREAPASMLVPMGVMVAVIFALGIYGSGLVDMTHIIAAQLMPPAAVPNPFSGGISL